MSQVELAEIIGITQSWVSKIESDEGEMNLSQLLRLSAEVPFDLILFFNQKISDEDYEKKVKAAL